MNIKDLRLLTRRNPKIMKGTSKGYLTFIMHLSPANISGHEVCKFRTKECTSLCLNTAGRGGIFKQGETENIISKARLRKTLQFFNSQSTFMLQLVAEIETAIGYATRKGLIPCFRLNGTSDITFERIPVLRNGETFPNVFSAFPTIQFYDYTKYPLALRSTDIPNYHLTFSFAETLANRANAQTWISAGHNVAVVFSNAQYPTTFIGLETFNGDESDLRFLDPKGIVVALYAKGRKAKKMIGGFVVDTKGL